MYIYSQNLSAIDNGIISSHLLKSFTLQTFQQSQQLCQRLHCFTFGGVGVAILSDDIKQVGEKKFVQTQPDANVWLRFGNRCQTERD